jgi:hypothetical protein
VFRTVGTKQSDSTGAHYESGIRMGHRQLPTDNPSQAPETVQPPIDRTGDQGQSKHAGRQAGVIYVIDEFRRIP